MTYSTDLRQRVVASARSGEPIASVSKRFSVARPTVRDGLGRHHRGELSPGVPGPKGGAGEAHGS